MFENVLDFLKTQDVEYTFGVNLRDLSPIRIGGTVKCIVYPRTVESYKHILHFLTSERIEYKIFGRMSNVLFIRDSYDIVAIRTDRMSSYVNSDGVMSAQCGLSLSSASYALASEGYGGISQLCGIPGSLGGLIRTCAGAYGKDISDVLESVSVYDPVKDKSYDIPRADIGFSYRHCPVDSGLAITGAKILLVRDDSEKIKDEIMHFRKMRNQAQPVGCKTLGSTFKRPVGVYAAQLIDMAGLRGKRVGGAEISQKHAGFIVNSGDATPADVIELMHLAAETVYKLYGVNLEPEIEMF